MRVLFLAIAVLCLVVQPGYAEHKRHKHHHYDNDSREQHEDRNDGEHCDDD